MSVPLVPLLPGALCGRSTRRWPVIAPSWRSQKLYCSRRASGSRPRRKRAAMKICAPSSFESERRITNDAAGACSRAGSPASQCGRGCVPRRTASAGRSARQCAVSVVNSSERNHCRPCSSTL